MHKIYQNEEKFGVYDCDIGEFFPLPDELSLYKMLCNINTGVNKFDVLTTGVKVEPIKLFDIGYNFVCDDSVHPIVFYKGYYGPIFLDVGDIVDFGGCVVTYAELNDRVLYLCGANLGFDIEQIITDYIGNIEIVTIRIIYID